MHNQQDEGQGAINPTPNRILKNYFFVIMEQKKLVSNDD